MESKQLTTQTQYKALTRAEQSYLAAKVSERFKVMSEPQIALKSTELVKYAMSLSGQKQLSDDVMVITCTELAKDLSTVFSTLTVDEVKLAIKHGLTKAEVRHVTAINLSVWIGDWKQNEKPKIEKSLAPKKIRAIEPNKEWSPEQKKNYVAYEKKKHKEGKEAFYVRCYALIDEVDPFTVEERKNAIDPAIKRLRAEYAKAAGNPIMKSMLSEIKKAGEQLKKGGKITNTKALAACKAACVIARWDKE